MEKESKLGLGSKSLALAQILIFAGTMAGFIGLLYVLILGGAELDETSEKLTYTMLGVLGTIVTGMANYFYSRQRPDTPALGETTVTTTPATTTVTTAVAPATATVTTPAQGGPTVETPKTE